MGKTRGCLAGVFLYFPSFCCLAERGKVIDFEVSGEQQLIFLPSAVDAKVGNEFLKKPGAHNIFRATLICQTMGKIVKLSSFGSAGQYNVI